MSAEIVVLLLGPIVVVIVGVLFLVMTHDRY